jgi:hypothetical protein
VSVAKRRLCFAGFFSVLAVMMTWPMIIEPGALYSTRQDYFLGAWNLWWVAQAATDASLSIFHTSMLYFPFGTGLEVQPLTLPQTLAAIPFTLWFGPLVAQNLLIVFSFAFAGWAAATWIFAIAESEASALVGGTIFAFAPYHYVYLSELNLVSVGFIPLYFLATHYLKRDPSLNRAAVAGIALAAVGLSSWYYGVAVGLAALVLSAYRLASANPDARSPQIKLEVMHWGACVLALAPVVARMLPGFLRPIDTEAAAKIGMSSAGMSFLMESFKGTHTEFALWSYVGVVALALAAMGIRPLRRSGPWLALLAIFFVLSCGERAVIGSFELPLPWAWLQGLPVVGLVRYPDRFFVLVQLGVAILAAFGMNRVRERAVTVGGRLGAGALALILLLLEFWPGTLPSLPPPEMPSLAEASSSTTTSAKPPGGVFNIPTRFRHLDGELMYRQLAHGRPIAGGYLTRRELNFDQGYRNNPVLDWLLAPEPNSTPENVSRALAESGFAYVVVHKRPLHEGARTKPHRIFGAFSMGSGEFLAKRLFPRYRRHGLEESVSSAWLAALHSELGEPISDTETLAVFRVPESTR